MAKDNLQGKKKNNLVVFQNCMVWVRFFPSLFKMADNYQMDLSTGQF